MLLVFTATINRPEEVLSEMQTKMIALLSQYGATDIGLQVPLDWDTLSEMQEAFYEAGVKSKTKKVAKK